MPLPRGAQAMLGRYQDGQRVGEGTRADHTFKGPRRGAFENVESATPTGSGVRHPLTDLSSRRTLVQIEYTLITRHLTWGKDALPGRVLVDHGTAPVQHHAEM
jgi:hypothetical protein